MDGTWNVYLGDKPVGRCSVEREGLYCRVRCRCSGIAEGICRLQLQCGEEKMDLGILVPVSGGFGLDRRIPAKNLPVGEFRFLTVSSAGYPEGQFIPVREGETFAYLSRLEDAVFARRDGVAGIILK